MAEKWEKKKLQAKLMALMKLGEFVCGNYF
jgi:hypothetical protein